MFNFLKKDSKVILYAPVDGKSIPIADVPDKIFAEKMMGDGIAFSYDGSIVYAPCDGTIIMIAETLHAFGIRAENGAEILIHIGMDTVSLEGKGFKKLVEIDRKVKRGTPIIRMDRKVLDEAGINLVTPMVITNGDEFSFEISEPCTCLACGKDGVVYFN